MDAHQEQFLRDEIFSLTLMATVGRANVYTPGLSERERKTFQSTLRSQLEEIVKEYATEVSENAHIQNILRLSTYLTTTHANVMQGGRFRIGTAQKALNLYLKYVWCLGKIPAPPHCPFDFQIIARLPAYTGPNWTVLDSENDYRTLVTAAKARTQGVSLAVWELQTYNNAQPVTGAEVHSGEQKKNIKSAKSWLRELLSEDGAEYTIAELVARTGKTEVNIRTMLGDLRSAKYCGSAGIFNTKSVHKNGKVYYRKT
jgi:hypothetical protein